MSALLMRFDPHTPASSCFKRGCFFPSCGWRDAAFVSSRHRAVCLCLFSALPYALALRVSAHMPVWIFALVSCPIWFCWYVASFSVILSGVLSS